MINNDSISRDARLFTDPDYLNRFIKNVESLFRNHPFYKYYKAYLINSVGLDRCQVQSNISVEIADLEMHHTIITLYDLVLIIVKYHLNSGNKINSLMILKEVIKCHQDNIVPITMLTVTNHKKYHNNNLFIPIDLVFGNFGELIDKYKEGMTFPILFKIQDYINNNINSRPDLYALNEKLLSIRDFYCYAPNNAGIDYNSLSIDYNNY